MNCVPAPSVSGPRQCHLKAVDDFCGYGFSLRTDGNSGKHLVENVESGSPAESCGLLNGDILLKINGKPLAGLLHKEAVQLIKMYSSEVLLLVVQPASWAAYRTRDDPVAAAEAEAIVCTALSHSKNSPSSFFALTPAEEQLLSGDTTTMSVVHARRRQFLNMAGGGCQPYATVNQYDHVSG